MIKIKYRAEIDFLRAIAVLAVIFHHAEATIFGLHLFRGGYVGVDVFFVISGYLISLLILKELNVTGKFSYFDFYKRRIRRIIPILLTVIVFFMPFAWFFLLPTPFVNFAESILSSILFSSNLYFYFTGQVYGTDPTLQPLLHTWSLSVEEQFYIFFPLLVITTNKYFKKDLLAIFFTTALISLCFAHWYTKQDYSLSFYTIPTRMWELLAGVILAKAELTYGRNNYAGYYQSIPILGIALIAYSVAFFNYGTPNPSFYTVIPVSGTMLYIWFANQNQRIVKLLSNKLFVGTGLISYSLYLWHFPILALEKFIEFRNNITIELLYVILLIFTLSILSYRYIEKPCRQQSVISTRKLLTILSILIITLGVISITVITNHGFRDRFYISEDFELDNKLLLNKWIESAEIIPSIKDVTKEKILIVGDSHARDTFNFLYSNQHLLKTFEFSVLPADIECFLHFINKTKCEKSLETANNERKIHLNNFANADTLLLSTQWSDNDINALEDILSLANYHRKKLIITSNAPEFITLSGTTLIDQFVLTENRLPNEIELIKIEKNYFNNLNLIKTDYFNKKLMAFSNNNNLIYLNKFDYLCSNKTESCDVLTNNSEKILFDYGHSSVKGAKYIGKKIHERNWFRTE